MCLHPDDANSEGAASALYFTYFSRPILSGSGYNRRDPWVVSPPAFQHVFITH
jgi:hypothetical protein